MFVSIYTEAKILSIRSFCPFISVDERPAILSEISNIKKLSKEEDKGIGHNPEKGDMTKDNIRPAN